MNYLIIWKDFKIFYGSHSRTVDEHSHPVIQLVFAIRGTFRSKDDSGDWAAKKGLLIAPNCPHECDASDVPIISIQIDPESSLGEWILSNQLKDRLIIDYPSKDITSIDINRFSDQAHMTRTFCNMIGVPPSLISKNSKFVQVSTPR